MAAQCQVCVSPHRETVEALVASGVRSQLAIEREFGLQRQAVGRHVREHVLRTAKAESRGRSVRVAPSPRPAAPQVASASSEAVPDSPVETFLRATGREAMRHQVEYLRETRDTLVLKGRQVGMSTAGGVLAVHTALSVPDVLVAIVSPSMKQSTEVTVKCRAAAVALGARMTKDASGLLEFENRSRVVSLAGTARAVRGWSADLLVIDEAAFVEAATFDAAMATTIATGGRTVIQSTPGNPVGRFYEMWHDEDIGDWARIKVRSDEAATISPEKLERKRRTMPAAAFAQEYEATFAVVSVTGQWFADYEDHVNEAVERLDVELPNREVS